MRVLFLVMLCSLLFACEPKHPQTDVSENQVTILLDSLKQESTTISQRERISKELYALVSLEENDSIKNTNFLTLAYQVYKAQDTLFFRIVNKEAHAVAQKIKDTLSIAETNWNYALFYRDINKPDSSFYRYQLAYKDYENIKNEFYAARMLYNMAFIQSRIKNYTASEVLLFRAVEKFEKLGKNKNLYKCYNHLGIIYSELEEFDKAFLYNNKALEYLNKIENKGTFIEGSLNDLGLMYQKKGDHKNAVLSFQKALENKNLKHKSIYLYARLLDNYAYNKFQLNDTTQVLSLFNNALHLRDSINSNGGILISKLHLGEFYHRYGNHERAMQNVKEAYELANEIHNNRDKLAALELLSKVDNANANQYLVKRIELNDSLQNEERNIRDKFTRIQFETANLEKKSERLSKEKQSIIGLGLLVISIFSLLLYIRIQKSKHKELLFEKEQQRSNEEIYSLMLKQQARLEEGRLEERKRISEELHDGVLGKLFGTRIGLGFLGLKGDAKTLQKYKTHVSGIQEIEKEIRNISHDLKNEILSSKLHYIVIVEDLIKAQSELGGYQYILENDEEIFWNDIEDKIKINFYRIIQEVLQNTNKYAKASFVQLHFKRVYDQIKLTITDDGVGFDLEKRKHKSGIGLKNILSRTHKLGGVFKIDSHVNKGTKNEVIIPIMQVANDEN